MLLGVLVSGSVPSKIHILGMLLTFVPERSLHVGQDASADQSREGIGNEISAEQNSVPRSEFFSGVPFGQDEEGTRKESGLDESKAESDTDHTAVRSDDTTQGGDHTPEQHGAADVDRRARDTVDDHVRWHLHENVSHIH